jgi:hypothetical protein
MSQEEYEDCVNCGRYIDRKYIGTFAVKLFDTLKKEYVWMPTCSPHCKKRMEE